MSTYLSLVPSDDDHVTSDSDVEPTGSLTFLPFSLYSPDKVNLEKVTLVRTDE